VRTAPGLLPGVETTNSGTVLDGSDVLNNFRDDAFFATEQVQALDSKLTLIAGIRADRSSANGDRNKRNVYPRVSGSYGSRTSARAQRSQGARWVGAHREPASLRGP